MGDVDVKDINFCVDFKVRIFTPTDEITYINFMLCSKRKRMEENISIDYILCYSHKYNKI